MPPPAVHAGRTLLPPRTSGPASQPRAGAATTASASPRVPPASSPGPRPGASVSRRAQSSHPTPRSAVNKTKQSHPRAVSRPTPNAEASGPTFFTHVVALRAPLLPCWCLLGSQPRATCLASCVAARPSPIPHHPNHLLCLCPRLRLVASVHSNSTPSSPLPASRPHCSERGGSGRPAAASTRRLSGCDRPGVRGAARPMV